MGAGPVALAMLLAGCFSGGPATLPDQGSSAATSGPPSSPSASANATLPATPTPSRAPDQNRSAQPKAPPQPDAVACDGRAPDYPRPTYGKGDPAIPSLTWAVLKTGFRVVVAWQSSMEVVGLLRYQAGAGNWEEVEDPLARRTHVFVIDHQPVGEAFCFQAKEGTSVASQVHSVQLINAMKAFDPVSRTYSVNLLTVANLEFDRSGVEQAHRRFAELLWDATDGRVRAGALIILYDDFDRPSVIQGGAGFAPFGFAHDVIFQHDDPRYGGYTTRDGIQERTGFMVVNQFEREPVLEEFAIPAGFVIMHEFGHYGFGAMDLYGDALTEPNCYDARTGISVMGNDERASEFDDENNRCPNESVISGYVPSWNKIRERYPEIPARQGLPDPGPGGDGGLVQLATFDLV